MKFVFMGTPEFAIPPMEKLNELGELALVVTQRDARRGRGKKFLPSPVKERAMDLGVEVYTPENVNSEEAYEKLKNIDADLFVVAAYGQILQEKILNLPRKYCVNVHASLLPRFRGAAPIQRAIMAGDKKSGITIMKMERGLDTGDMACRREIEIDGYCGGELEAELSFIGAELLEEFIDSVKKGTESFVPQKEDLATYAEKITKEDFYLNFQRETTKDLVRHILAFAPNDGARVKYGEKLLKIYQARELENSSSVEPGTILAARKQLIIKTIDGAIEILEIQASGKRKMKTQDFLLGNSLKENTKIGD